MTDLSTATMPPAVPPGGPAPRDEAAAISWSGSTWGLAGLGFFNLLLTIITLGIYHFWAKTEVRRRIANSIRINDEPLEYTGTGMELFLGFLIVLIGILLPFQLLAVGAQVWLGPAGGVVVLLFLPLIWYLYNVAIYRARRYRRSRLRWRGVRGSVVGSSWAYGWHSLWTAFVSAFTSGWLTPWRDNFLHRTVTKETRFGDRAFNYTGKAGPLYPSYTIAWIGSIVLLGLIGALGFAIIYPLSLPIQEAMATATNADGKPDWNDPALKQQLGLFFSLMALGYGFLALYGVTASVLWSLFYAREYRYFASETTLEGLRFKLDVKGWSMFWLFLSNTLMSILTLTILAPVAEARVARYFVSRLSASGSIDFAGIQQSQAKLSKTGEGLAEAFDVEAASYFILSI
jgi:uncharacterized membrane protein YjgN (DUF898 family)